MDSKFIHICLTNWLLFMTYKISTSDSKQPNRVDWVESQIVFVLFLHGKKGFRFNSKAQKIWEHHSFESLREIVVEN